MLAGNRVDNRSHPGLRVVAPEGRIEREQRGKEERSAGEALGKC